MKPECFSDELGVQAFCDALIIKFQWLLLGQGWLRHLLMCFHTWRVQCGCGADTWWERGMFTKVVIPRSCLSAHAKGEGGAG